MVSEEMEMPSEEVVVRRRQTKVQLQAEAEKEQLRKVLSTKEGRAVLWRLLASTKLFSTGMNVDPHHMAYSCGQRSVGLGLYTEILAVDRGAYALMIDESVEGNND